jgi:uncharacterized membrane protein
VCPRPATLLGPVGFQNDELPDYADFVYVAFTIGMTFQEPQRSPEQRQASRCNR